MYQNKWSCIILFLRYGGWWIVIFHFGLFFALLKNKIKIKKKMKKKNTWRYHHFTHVYQKLWSDDVQFLIYGAQWMDWQTDGQKKWQIEVDAPPKNVWGLASYLPLWLYTGPVFLFFCLFLIYIVCTPLFCWVGWASNQIFKKRGGLDRTSTFRGGCWKEGVDFFQGGCNFHQKKLKSEIFKNKKSL